MDLLLKDKLAVVTGASSGIGLAVSETLAEAGCNLIMAARNADRLGDAAKAIAERYKVSVRSFPADLSKPADQAGLAAVSGEADILVNNAGANPAGEIDDISDEVWRTAWDLKVFGYINIIRLLYPEMKRRGRGVIVNIIGNSGEQMNSKYILGSSGNLALMGLTRALGGRSPDFGIRVVGVNPGLTATDRAKTLLRTWSQSRFGTPDKGAEVMADMKLPFGRMCEPKEIANVVAFLSSPRAGYVSGTIVTVDGGTSNRNG